MNEKQVLDYIGLQHELEEISEAFPFAALFSVGKSCAGRDITALRIGRSSAYALITAAFHGSEAITATVLLKFIKELCRALKNDAVLAGFRAQKAMAGRGVIFVPMVNPDGCEIALHGAAGAGEMAPQVQRLCRGDYKHWNANLRGVDINHNFSAGWKALHEAERHAGIFGPAPRRYGGTMPESEPETKALVGLCRSRTVRHAVALHTQGEVIYWRYGKQEPPRSRKMAEIFATSSRYSMADATGLAAGGGFKDWFIEEFFRPGFTVELGRGENPLPAEELPQLYLRVRELLMLASIM